MVLDILINDEEWMVRLEVARQGYGLDILVNDEDPHVRKLAKHMEGSVIHRIVRRPGYYENILLVVWEDKYEIKSGFFNTNSISEWYSTYVKKSEINSLNQIKEIMEKILGV